MQDTCQCSIKSSQFFFIIATGAAISWLACFFLLKEPEGGVDDEYVISSVDQAIAGEARVRSETEAELAVIFAGSEKVGLADKGTGLTVTAKFKDMAELRAAMARLMPTGGKSNPAQ